MLLKRRIALESKLQNKRKEGGWKNSFRYRFSNTDSTKINRPGHNIRMYWTNFWQPNVHIQQNTLKIKLLLKLVVHIFTLLLPPFASKLVNYSWHSEILNFRKNSKSTTFSFENSDLTIFQPFSKTHCASND